MGLAAVVLAHDLLDSLGGFVGVVEWDGADVVVGNVSLDNAVKQVTTDKAEFTVDSGSGTADVVPGLVVVVREGRIGVLQEGDGNYYVLVMLTNYARRIECTRNIAQGIVQSGENVPSQWLTQRYGTPYQTSKFNQPKFDPI